MAATGSTADRSSVRARSWAPRSFSASRHGTPRIRFRGFRRALLYRAVGLLERFCGMVMWVGDA